jgi:energy-coupling factor transporter ATP-binding protein EcfA2
MWGLNGSGKTSLLRVLHAALNNEAQGLSRIPFSTAEVHIYLEGSKQRIVRRLDKAREDDDDDFELIEEEYVQTPDGNYQLVAHLQGLRWETVFIDPSGPPKNFPGALSHTYLPISRLAESRVAVRRGMNRLAREGLDDSVFDTLFADQVKARWQYYNSGALDKISAVQQQGLAEILSLLFGGVGETAIPLAPAPEAAVAFELVSQFLTRQGIRSAFTQKTFAARYDRERELQEVVRRIEKVLDDIEMALEPQRALQALISQLYSGNKQLAFDNRGIQVRVDDGAIPLESLSSGEKQLLQVLLETLAASDASVLIDEPELSMHVDWQQRLVASMRTVNPECQLLLATHSPEVMADVPDDKIFEL